MNDWSLEEKEKEDDGIVAGVVVVVVVGIVNRGGGGCWLLFDWEIILFAIYDTVWRDESASPSPSLERQTWRESVVFGADSTSSRIDAVDGHHGHGDW